MGQIADMDGHKVSVHLIFWISCNSLKEAFAVICNDTPCL